MVRMFLDVRVHKYETLVNVGGGGKDKKVSIMGVLEKITRPTTDRDGMDTLSMVELIVGRMCSGVASPLGS